MELLFGEAPFSASYYSRKTDIEGEIALKGGGGGQERVKGWRVDTPMHTMKC